MVKNKWYVLHVRTGSELDVVEQLRKNDYEAACPRRKMKERKKGVWVNLLKTMFRGYVFVHTEMSDTDYYKLENMPGVITILRGANPYPTPVPDDEIMAVLRMCNDGDIVGVSKILIDGDSVTVTEGPLKGWEGQIVNVQPRRFRASVRFQIGDQEKIVELAIEVVEKV